MKMFQVIKSLSNTNMFLFHHPLHHTLVLIDSELLCLDADEFSLPPSSGEKAPPPLLRWSCGINKTLWRNTSPTRSVKPGLPAPLPPTNQNMPSHALAAAHWLSPGGGERADTTSSACPSLIFIHTLN